jgi:protein-serine/threonine kinase
LISGVSYLHHKKIVHRDLKLENLLLDRNRNVIITDFGFANNFENRQDDLMATSCGSPCYAAPELVVQDGLYAGSAVDVWSCGVILYAMLAGYLPYDDDPKNPEGDNINLLYKYIMATPLSFPDYITAEPRDLLCKMLVPDPLKRADLETVMAHSWLAPYRDLFRFSVEDLERAAIEQQNKKRAVYRQQMMMQQQMAEQQANGRTIRGNGANGEASVKQARHQSAVATSTTMPDRMYESGSQSNGGRSRPTTNLPTLAAPLESVAAPPEREMSRVNNDETSMAPPSAYPTGKKSAAQKTQRHTIQLEYAAEAADKKREADSSRAAVPATPRVASRNEEDTIMQSDAPLSPTSEITKGLEAVQIPTTTAVFPSAEQKTSLTGTNSAIQSGRRSSAASTPRVPSNPQPSSVSPDTTSTRIASGGAGSRSEARKSTRATRSSNGPSTPISPSPTDLAAVGKAEKSATRQRKGLSTQQPFFARLMNSSTGSSDGGHGSPRPNSSTRKDETPATPDTNKEAASPDIGRKNNNSRRKAMSLVVGRYADQATPASKEREKTATPKAVKEERRLTGRLRKTTLTPDNGAKFETPVKSSQKQAQQSPSAASVMTTNESLRQSTRSSNKRTDGSTPFDQRLNESNTTVGPSSNAAKKVMDWFRKKSLSRAGFDEKSPLGSFEEEQTSPPRLVVTKESGKEEEKVQRVAIPARIESSPSSRSTSGTHSQTSQATDNTALTTATEDSLIGASSNGNKSSASTVQQQATPRPSAVAGTRSRAKVDDSALRVHQGAVDQSALTSRPPHEVLEQVQMALFAMGIDVKKEKEEEFKFECVRRKRPKTLMGATQGLGLSIRTSVFPPSQAELERSSAGRRPTSPPMTMSPSTQGMSTSPSTAGSLRAFLRRGSSQHVASGSSATANEADAFPNPLYGEASVDGGQEVRFSVEVTKIKNLPGLYSLDIRRMKGNLWAYKFLYHALLDRCQLSNKTVV